MTRSQSFTIETLTYSTSRLVWLDGTKVAILFPPAEPGAPFQLYPHPDTYRGLDFAGLPAPLRPEFMPFASLEAVEAFLGIGRDATAPRKAAPRAKSGRRARQEAERLAA